MLQDFFTPYTRHWFSHRELTCTSVGTKNASSYSTVETKLSRRVCVVVTANVPKCTLPVAWFDVKFKWAKTKLLLVLTDAAAVQVWIRIPKYQICACEVLHKELHTNNRNCCLLIYCSQNNSILKLYILQDSVGSRYSFRSRQFGESAETNQFCKYNQCTENMVLNLMPKRRNTR